MMSDYLKALIEQLNPQGNVLQVGFYSDACIQEIQKYHPRAYTLIESDPEKITRAKKWAPDVITIDSSWEAALPKLGIFDTLLFTSTTLLQSSNKETSSSPPKRVYTSPTSKTGMNALSFGHGSATLEMAEDMFPDLSSIQYSDEDLDAFLKTIPFSIEHLTPFLEELKTNGQITEEQLHRVLKQHQKTPKTSFNPLIHFLQNCLKSHMHDKSLASWIEPKASSKYDCPDFFEQIITQPNAKYEEYPHGEKQLLMILKKG